jgi:hypothetical protein
MTPECLFFDELDGPINALREDLGQLCNTASERSSRAADGRRAERCAGAVIDDRYSGARP